MGLVIIGNQEVWVVGADVYCCSQDHVKAVFGLGLLVAVVGGLDAVMG